MATKLNRDFRKVNLDTSLFIESFGLTVRMTPNVTIKEIIDTVGTLTYIDNRGINDDLDQHSNPVAYFDVCFHDGRGEDGKNCAEFIKRLKNNLGTRLLSLSIHGWVQDSSQPYGNTAMKREVLYAKTGFNGSSHWLYHRHGNTPYNDGPRF